MHIGFLVFSGHLMLQFSVTVQTSRSEMLQMEDADRDQQTNRSAYHRPTRLVKYGTLMENGAVIFSRPGVDTYSAVTIDDVERRDWKEGIYVGARNWVFKLDLTLNETQALEITPTTGELTECYKENRHEDCDNFIKYIHVGRNSTVEEVVVCGTFAYSPACSKRSATELSKEVERIPGLCPRDPRGTLGAHSTGDKLFLGFVDTGGLKQSKIVASTLEKDEKAMHTMESKNWLNAAEFVGAFSLNERDPFVYIVFWEVALEAVEDDVIFSRVARICKDDEGGQWEGGTGHFNSFMKARLYCGSKHFKVQSISYKTDYTYFWATFASQNNGTAICGFSVAELDDVFEGPNLCRRKKSRKWRACNPPHPTEDDDVAESCFGSRSAKEVTEYTLMSETVSHNCSRPPFVTDANLKKIAVSSERQGVFTAFAGDDQGRVWKIDFAGCNVSNVHVWEVVPASSKTRDINGLLILKDSIIVLTHEEVLKIPKDKKYPSGEMPKDEERLLGEITQPTARKATTTKPTKATPFNHSNSRKKFSYSQTSIFLIAAAILGG